MSLATPSTVIKMEVLVMGSYGSSTFKCVLNNRKDPLRNKEGYSRSRVGKLWPHEASQRNSCGLPNVSKSESNIVNILFSFHALESAHQKATDNEGLHKDRVTPN